MSVDAKLRDAFAIFDTDNSGFLDRQQFKDVLLAKSEAGTPLSEAEVSAVFDRVDADNSGSIDIEEFIAWSKRAGDYNPGDFGKLITIAMPDGDADLLSLVMANPGEKLLGTMEVNLFGNKEGSPPVTAPPLVAAVVASRPDLLVQLLQAGHSLSSEITAEGLDWPDRSGSGRWCAAGMPLAGVVNGDHTGSGLWSAATLAARLGDTACLDAIHKEGGVDLGSHRDGAGRSAALAAVAGNHVECLERLLLGDDWGAGQSPPHPDVAKDHVNKDGHSLLDIAASSGSEACLRLLLTPPLRPLFDVDAASAGPNRPPAHESAIRGHVGCLQLLAELGGADLSVCSKTDHEAVLTMTASQARLASGSTPAMCAVQGGHPHVLRYLLDQKVDLSVMTDTPTSPTMIRYGYGRENVHTQATYHHVQSRSPPASPEIIEMINVHRAQEQGVLDLSVAKVSKGSTAAAAAAAEGAGSSSSEEEAAVLARLSQTMAQHGVRWLYPGQKATPLAAAVINDDADAVRALVEEHGHDVNARMGPTGFTAAIAAAAEGKAAALRRLVLLGAKVDVAASNSELCETAALCAAAGGHEECLGIIKDAGVEIGAQQAGGMLFNGAHLACQNGSVGCLKIIAEGSPDALRAQDLQGVTPLHYACLKAHPDCVQVLLEAGVDVAVLDKADKCASDYTGFGEDKEAGERCACLIREFTAPKPAK